MPSHDVIHQLPDSVANQIAAGEVIQRPASVVKELVENSIDAGATSVQIIIKDAGKTLIQVVDNGTGMSVTDARMAFERHATSKIRQADDLFTLHTMGFRGEALPSIAAVAEIDMRTMRADEQMGTQLVIKASRVESQQPVACVTGTNISVKHLFYNFVARRRFLKKDSVELGHIMREFERLALVNPGVEFTLTHNDAVVHQLPPRNDLQSRISDLFGRNIAKQTVPLQTQTTLVNISGYIGLPSAARHRGALQFFFVNGRNMRHPYFHKALLSCYRDLIDAEAQPNYFVNFEVEPSRIDVNIHPQKHEIKFEDEQLIWQVLTAAIKEALGKYNVGPAIDFAATDVPDIPPLVQQRDKAPTPTAPVSNMLDPNYNPFVTGQTRTPLQRGERPSALNVRGWQQMFEDLTPASPTSTQLFADEALPVTAADGQFMQIKNRWIVTPSKSGLMVVDQHRAHVRVLYDRFLPAVKTGDVASQHVIFAEPMTLTARQQAILDGAMPVLQSLGFELAKQADNTWTITGVPCQLNLTDPRTVITSILDDLAETGADPAEEQRNRLALSMAQAAAVKADQPLTATEMARLVADLMRCTTPGMTPDGRRTVHILSAEALAALLH